MSKNKFPSLWRDGVSSTSEMADLKSNDAQGFQWYSPKQSSFSILLEILGNFLCNKNYDKLHLSFVG
jgi:hypothetical protein